ncbi:mannose-6-phosphate isomerase [Bradyrhizobium macuxiense]|uniref:Mannose-6-phosphate isomerase n=1 Tax=Bradyrhizobium macuxiense TaxID=1755647 RepID=A0A560KW20_9BRAD|nr:AGE family epimerase/isomerase [Bradyrhizobium macuxiense]TWB87317.1 mannose-6-phosphate isomerase [Bradyrhizobium macuxiense]
MDQFSKFRNWALQRALPLWASIGFDHSAKLFEEAVDFDASPLISMHRRVMVQARQISVYALASQRGWFHGRDIALAAGRSMIRSFWAVDGEPGWVFSIRRDGTVADSPRDLYAHAFVLFALAWLIKLSPDDLFYRSIEETILFLDDRLADRQHGGFWDALPRPDSLRRQNPHMHLLEAYLELFEATSQARYLDRAGALVALASRKFIGSDRGVLREYFDDRWQVIPAPGAGSVEPGHQFEWGWLLRRYEGLASVSLESEVRRLVSSALTLGTDRMQGRIVDEIGEDGSVRRRSSRSWPHAEALKSLAVETRRGSGNYREDIAALLGRLVNVHCPERLGGGWLDHVSDKDEPISTSMPASTLYHLIFALAECERCL